ncbi:MAG: HU family DNA-binding protein [Candidatus Marinimicrobia bacterium]|jgi:nucleoid DNA-binding protein|nr:HU family DNA-binding protein [Candidatus Neomarinimicrobiota bacterium]
MTTNEIIKLLSERLGCSQVKAKKTFVATMETFKGIIQKEDIFSLPKYGTFKVKKKKRRKSFNPKKKIYLMLPIKNVLSFKPSNILKNEVKKWRIK